MRILPVSLVFLIACSLPSQVVPPPAGEEVTEAEAVRRKQAASRADGEDASIVKEKEAKEWESLTPEQRLARTATHGAGSYLRIDAAVHPPRLLPGQTGIVKVTLALLGDAVIPSPAPLTWQTASIQGDLSLGQATLLPARSSNLAKGYAGQQVYDSWAIAELPITVAPAAKLGAKVPFRVSLTVDLYSGGSATPIGRFIDHANGVVEIGQSHDPAVQSGRRPEVGTGGADAKSAAGAKGPEVPRLIEGKPPVRAIPASSEGLAPAGAGASPQPSPTQEVPTPIQDEESHGMPIPFLLGGGGLILVLLLLVAKRR
jgi:hypothetical protein